MGWVILALGVISSGLVFYSATQTDYERFQFQARLSGGWYTTRRRMRNRFKDDQLTVLLRRSGLQISAPMYHYFRIAATSVFAFIAIMGLLSGHGLTLVFPVLIWFGLEYRRPFPMHFGFQWLQKQAAANRDRSLYLLYRLLLQEVMAFKDSRIGLNDMLRRQLHRVPTIRSFLERCLNQWMEDPVKALQQFGEDLGTKQAKNFAHMLTQIEEAGTDVALDIFQNNQESFRTDRIAAFTTYLQSRALLGTALTMLGVGAAIYDITVIIQVYTATLMKASFGG
ncbi:hypothetical protein JC200_23845 (plasmid) [Alicyclobacillus sp. ALC3]|nr:hypothetical protein JC200_23845 [Alicyclobacillus sp. ALC3]